MRKNLEIEIKLNKTIEGLEKYKRMAYLPIVKSNQKCFSSLSKYGGYPYLRNENDWPVCENCQKHMQHFLQLNLKDLPENNGDGLIQLFYCTNDEKECVIKMESFSPFSKAVMCRKIDIDKASAIIAPNIEEVFDEKIIISWDPKVDYPCFEEFDLLGIKLEFYDDVLELLEERELCQPIYEDKLFGWPYWVQSEEYPLDRNTKTRMELLFQIGGSENIPYMFGDAGIGHITQSPDNENELAFGWACG
jgi:uncharacterized protein YwqG